MCENNLKPPYMPKISFQKVLESENISMDFADLADSTT